MLGSWLRAYRTQHIIGLMIKIYCSDVMVMVFTQDIMEKPQAGSREIHVQHSCFPPSGCVTLSPAIKNVAAYIQSFCQENPTSLQDL